MTKPIIKIFGRLQRQGPPLPIPNREVKPASADDTAIPGGKVGRRQDYKPPQEIGEVFFVDQFYKYQRLYMNYI